MAGLGPWLCEGFSSRIRAAGASREGGTPPRGRLAERIVAVSPASCRCYAHHCSALSTYVRTKTGDVRKPAVALPLP